MGHSLIRLAALLTAATALQPVLAQSVQPSNTASGAPETLPPTAGVVLAPGWSLQPLAFSELGYDSNPTLTFLNNKGSSFIRSGAGFDLTTSTPRTTATVSANGSVLDYFNDNVFPDPTRYAGSAKADVGYSIQPNLTASTGAFIDYDGQSAYKSQTDGAHATLGYRDGELASSLRARFSDVQYFDGKDAQGSPLSLGPSFNYNRSELTWAGLLGNSWRVSPYAEASGARVNYTDQPNPAQLNRSADDYDIKGGVRLALSPTVSADAGWRFNERDTDDRRVTSFSSNGFDGSLTWKPSPLFLFSASVERYIGEPSTDLAVLADVHSYQAKVTYVPVRAVSLSAAGGWLAVSDIGSGVHYQAPFADAQAAWDYNSHVEFYTALHYQNYAIQSQNVEFSDVRVMSGVRIIPDGQNLSQGESLDSLIARLGDARRLSNSELTVSAGYSWFGLPDMKMVNIIGGQFFDQAVGQVAGGDGSLNGARTDVRLSNFAEGALPDGRMASFGLSGFYANYQGTTRSHCMYSLTTDCAIVNIADTSSALPNNTGTFGNLNVTTRRNADYYGIAIDSRLGGAPDGSSKDAAPAQELSPFRVGVAMRGINENSSLTSVDPLVNDPVKYKESVNTLYSGGYVGLEKKAALGDGWSIGLDGTAGIYYTNTQYQGRYNGYTLVFPVGYFSDTGTASGSLDKGSFIGTLRLDLKRQLGWGTLGAFGQGEYLSYVPRIAYNNNDQANGVLWGGVNGNQAGTRIASSDAFNFTTGLSVSVPVN